MDFARICLLSLTTLFIAFTIAGVTSASDDPPRFQTVGEYVEAYALEPNADVKQELFFDLTWHVRKGNIEVDLDAAEQLILLCTQVSRDSLSNHVRMAALNFLLQNPHPVAADILHELMTHPNLDTAKFFRYYGLKILIGLRDNRAFPFLLEQLHIPQKDGHEETIRLLAELGDPRAIKPLEDIIYDENLEARFKEQILEGYKRRNMQPRYVDDQARERAAEERENARRAVRDIRLYLDLNIVCPFDLEDYVYDILSKNGFAILPEPRNEMFEFYSPEYPFITTDIVFHTFMILMRAGLDELETLVLRNRVSDFTLNMVRASLDQKESLLGKRLPELADRNAAFFAVPAILCGSTTLKELNLTWSWQRIIEEELDRIHKAAGVTYSEIQDFKEDYTEYKPRGRHSAKPELSGYFRGMMWLGRAFFPVESEDATKQVLLLLDVLEHKPDLREEWENLDRLLGQFFGERDDLAFPDYFDTAVEVAGSNNQIRVRSILESKTKFKAFRAGLRRLPFPRINTAYIRWPQSMEWQTRTLGLRVFGQRYTRDEDIFQQLMMSYWPPSGLHVAAELLGSRRAREILQSQTDTLIPMELTTPVPPEDRLSGFGEAYLYCYETVFDPDPRVPAFMRREAWEEKQINSALGAWAEVRHSIALYAKAAHKYLGTSEMTDRFHGYVEPYPKFFSRLDSLVQRVDTLFAAADLFGRIETDCEEIQRELEEDYGPPNAMGRYRSKHRKSYEVLYQRQLETIRLERSMLHEFSSILKHLENIAQKELQGQPQTVEDGIFLKNLGGRLRSLSFNRSSMNVAPEPMSIVIDVATEYLNAECLEVGVGRPLPIYVLVPDKDRHFVCKGAVYTYYEFTWPFTDRLDDTRWRSASMQLDAMGILPWIATRPQLGLQGP